MVGKSSAEADPETSSFISPLPTRKSRSAFDAMMISYLRWSRRSPVGRGLQILGLM
jgi:hypothetical protein